MLTTTKQREILSEPPGTICKFPMMGRVGRPGSTNAHNVLNSSRWAQKCSPSCFSIRILGELAGRALSCNDNTVAVTAARDELQDEVARRSRHPVLLGGGAGPSGSLIARPLRTIVMLKYAAGPESADKVSGAHEPYRRSLSPHRSRSDWARRIRITSEPREQFSARTPHAR
jgi:hypothetical protein